MAREPRVRDADVPEISRTPATTYRKRDVSRRTKSKVIPALMTVESAEKHVLDTFGTPEKAEHWLSRPNPLFGGKTPRQVLQADPSWVEAALVRIDNGVYA